MMIEPDICYRALRSRDPRFDGRFFTAVLTTGIYCRPICPARTPKSNNVRFFPCAAAAEEAGFRPCLRCRPESAPGTPAWLGTSATVSRALRLIDEGVLDDGGVEALAIPLGVGVRHLRRLFEEHLGASPIRVAQTCRVHFAKRLIDETSLPVTEIAFAAGFSSVRRFNHAFKTAFHQSPSQLRRGRKESPLESGQLRLKLAYRPPLDAAWMMAFLNARAIPGVETVEGGVYKRSVVWEGTAGVIAVAPNEPEGHLELSLPQTFSRNLAGIVGKVRGMFDLGADPGALSACFAGDPLLSKLAAERPGIRLPGAWDPFELAVRAILGQQVSVQAATTVSGQLVKAYGEPLPGPRAPAGPSRLFPRPERLARARFNRVGIPGKRAAAIRNLAKAVTGGRLDLNHPMAPGEAVETLTALPGIGPWTAEYVAMRAFGEPDAFPCGDLGLIRALTPPGGKPVAQRALARRAESWRPWRAYAALLLWSSLRQGG